MLQPSYKSLVYNVNYTLYIEINIYNANFIFEKIKLYFLEATNTCQSVEYQLEIIEKNLSLILVKDKVNIKYMNKK